MIEFESVSKTYRDGTTAVDNLSLVVPSDKITVIVGPSGCGKTTTLRMINRMLEPSKGKITWDGKPIKSRRKTALRRQMGYVIQSGGLFPHRTVLENIATVPDLLRWDKQKSRKRAAELLGSVGLDRKLGQRYPAQLSGGQQQRVGVARALAADPLVLLMDEPFSAVDPVVRGELHEFFLGLQRQLSKTIILITHDIDEAIKLGDQVAILRVGGKLAQVGTPQQLLEQPADAFVEGFVGKDRGYRSLSFQPASALTLGGVQVVRDAGTASGQGPVLVVDADARPVGWADPTRPGALIPLGATFDPETDSLRAALDAALTSPTGLAVAAIGASRRYAGVVDVDTILRQVTQTRGHLTESITVRPYDQPESAFGPSADLPAQPYEDPDATAIRDVPPAAGWDHDDPDATRIAGPLPDDPSAEHPSSEDLQAGDLQAGDLLAEAPGSEPDEPQSDEPQPEGPQAEELQPEESVAEEPAPEERAAEDVPFRAEWQAADEESGSAEEPVSAEESAPADEQDAAADSDDHDREPPR